MEAQVMGKLTGRVAVVTGAAQGIGQAIAERFIAEGAYVLCADLNPSVREAASTLGERAQSIIADVSLASDVLSMITAAHERLRAAWIFCATMPE